MADESRTMWDPLWEYVLDDYEGADTPRDTSKQRRRRKQKAEEEETNFFGRNGLSLMDGDSTDEYESNSWRRYDSRDDAEDLGGSWTWGSGESAPQSSSSKRHPWRRNKSKESERTNSGDDGSMWDLFVSPEAPTGQDQKKKSNLRSSMKKNSSEKSQGSSTKQMSFKQVDSLTVSNDKESAEPVQKKKGFFRRRFSKQEEDTAYSSSSRRFSAKEKARGQTQSMPTQNRQRVSFDTVSAPSRRPRREYEANRQRSIEDQPDESFDPLTMLFEVAEKLDPWASDSDSNSETTASDHTNLSDEVFVPSVDDTSLTHEYPTGQVNEIRLQFSPAVKEADIDQSSIVVGEPSIRGGPELLPLTRTRGIIAQEVSNPSQLRRDDAIDRVHSPADENRNDPPFFATDSEQGTDYGGDHDRGPVVGEKRDLQHRTGLKRLVCCREKDHTNGNNLKQLDAGDSSDLFPTTRIISDEDEVLSSIYSQKADFSNGVMGVPSDKFADTKGPQSLYAYDYESNENLDVLYSEFGKEARKSLFLRKLGPPPALLSSSDNDQVVIKVEASTVSDTDSIIRRGDWWGLKSAPLPNTPGVDFVGKIHHIKQKTSTKYGLVPCQTVLSLVKWGGNSRFITMEPDALVKVPEGLDPAQVACLPEMYLSAFQALHFGQHRTIRYKSNSLKGKSVLILGFMANNMGTALIELALKAGAAHVYATAKKKHWKTIVGHGVMPLSQDPIEWILRVEGTIDLVLATNGGVREDLSKIHYRALRSTGQLILCGHRTVGNDVPVSQWEKQHNPASLVCSKNKALTKLQSKSHAYDVFEQWDSDLALCKTDLEYLLTLLESGEISPTIVDRIPLSKVPRAHELLEAKRLPGFLVCEPWMKAKQRAVYM